MYLFGDNRVGGPVGYLTDDMYGHFEDDAAWLTAWGLPIQACTVRRIFVFASPSAVMETCDLRFGIYDANAGPPSQTWPLFAQTGILQIPPAAPVQWYSLDCFIVLSAGYFVLGVLDAVGGKTWSAGIHYTVAAPPALLCQQDIVPPCVFPDPLGLCTTANMSWSIYADDGLDTPFTPTAACSNQPGCSCGD